MSWSTSCLLPWDTLVVERVRVAIAAGIAGAKQWPDDANARIEVDGTSSHVVFPAVLVERPHWEIEKHSPAPRATSS